MKNPKCNEFLKEIIELVKSYYPELISNDSGKAAFFNEIKNFSIIYQNDSEKSSWMEVSIQCEIDGEVFRNGMERKIEND